MKQQSFIPGYVIDTSAIIDLTSRVYPSDVFPSLQKRLTELARAGDIIAPQQVIDELKRYPTGKAYIWTKNAQIKNSDFNTIQQQIVREIMNDPTTTKLVDWTDEFEQADPYIIALAESKGWKVITSEVIVNNPKKTPKIPDVCKKRGVQCLNVLQFLRDSKIKT